MVKYKKQTRYNVLSMRISDKEMVALSEMRQQTRKSTTTLLREAMRLYVESRELIANQTISV